MSTPEARARANQKQNDKRRGKRFGFFVEKPTVKLVDAHRGEMSRSAFVAQLIHDHLPPAQKRAR